MDRSYAWFDTAVGRCAVVWTDLGICGVQLPEPSPARAKAVLGRRYPAAVEREPPDEVRAAVASMVALVEGTHVDLRDVTVDLEGVSPFEQRVYDEARTIPPGRTVTYGDLARRLGAGVDPRAVGQALGRNPCPIVVPCHRVVAADGTLGGFSAPGGADTKRRLLQREGAAAAPPTLFDP